jgi:LVIVD repeat
MNGNALLRLLPFLLVILTLFGCGEPADVIVQPEPSSYFDILGTTGTRGFAEDMDLEGDKLYVAEFSSGIGIYDVSDPASMVLDKRLSTPDRAEVVDAVPEMNALIVQVRTINYIYFLDSLDAAEKTTLGSAGVSEIVSVATRDSVRSQNFADVPTVEADIARVLFADSNDGIQVVTVWLDSTDLLHFPIDTTLIFSQDERLTLNFPGIGEAGVTPIGDFNTVAVSLMDYGVGFADISKEVEDVDGVWYSDIDTPGEALGLAYENDHVFVADGVGGLAVIDVSDIVNPELVATWKLDGLDHASTVFVRNGKLILIDANDGAYFLDVSDPAAPIFKDEFVVRYPTSAVFLSDDEVIISSRLDGLTSIRLNF